MTEDFYMKVGLAGTGWRAQMYVRVMKALGEEFEVSAVYVHSESSREREEKNFPGKVYTDYDEFLATKPDCVVFMLKYGAALPFAEKAMEQGIPVLCETPPAATVEELQAWYQAKEKYNGKVQVAEQYCFQPYYQALIHMIDQGKLGTISNLDISQAHDYHGMSVMRRLLGTGMENCRITARIYDFPVNYHCGREGLHKGEKTIVDTRKRAEFVFPDGKVGFFDFSGEQYFNYFRTRHLTLQGDCGEVHDQQAAWLGQDGYPVRGSIQRDELGQYSNLEGYGMRSLRLNGEILYRNPYADRDLRLTDEEIAVAQMMEGMKTYVETGKEVYPLEEALQDTYLFLMMDEAAKEGKEIQTQDQCWKKQ